jgi:IS5 family transposase
MMYLKFRYQLGYETLVKEVSDSISWRRFCRIGLEKEVLHSTTLIKLSKKYRNVSIKKKALNISKVAKRRTGEAIKEIDKITDKIVATADIVVQEATGVLKNAYHKLWRDGENASRSTKQLVEKLTKQLQMVQRIIDQSKQVVSGNRKIPDRIVSIYDTDARPIKKGKPQKPTEFGYKVLIQETEDGVITGYEVYCGNPADDTLLYGSLEKHQELFGKAPWGIAGDRGFGSKANEELCEKEGVKRISLPKKGKLSKKQKVKEKQPSFRRLQRFRAGIEARISLLKRKYGMGRSLSRGYQGTQTWVGCGILAYNLQKIASMI